MELSIFYFRLLKSNCTKDDNHATFSNINLIIRSD